MPSEASPPLRGVPRDAPDEVDGLLPLSAKLMLLDRASMELEATLLLGEVPRDAADEVDGL